jgi:homogentisate 1,2-dioxygenase
VREPRRVLPPARARADRLQRAGQQRDFVALLAAFDDAAESGPVGVIRKAGGRLWRNSHAATPFDVVKSHGNLAPLR